MDIGATQITNLFRSLESIWGRGGGSGSNDVGGFITSVGSGQLTTMHISAFANQINDLQRMLTTSNNEAAIAGFRGFMTTLTGDASHGDLYNFVNMGAAALKSGDTAFLVDLMAGYHNLADDFRSAPLAREVAVEAGTTYSELGLGASRLYSRAAVHVMDADEKGGVSVQDALRDYLDTWRWVRTSDLGLEQRQAEVRRLGQGVLEQRGTLDVQDFLRRYREEFPAPVGAGN